MSMEAGCVGRNAEYCVEEPLLGDTSDTLVMSATLNFPLDSQHPGDPLHTGILMVLYYQCSCQGALNDSGSFDVFLDVFLCQRRHQSFYLVHLKPFLQGVATSSYA